MSALQPIKAPGLILPSEPPKTCGACSWSRTLPDITLVECASMPPTPCVIGAQMTPGGQKLDVQLVRPNVPRTLPACRLFERKANA